MGRMPDGASVPSVQWLSAGLPPLNGLVSSQPVYLGCSPRQWAGPWLAGALAARRWSVARLAVASLVKVFGAVFLGNPRTADGVHAHGRDG
jgi:hypothetical protein